MLGGAEWSSRCLSVFLHEKQTLAPAPHSVNEIFDPRGTVLLKMLN